MMIETSIENGLQLRFLRTTINDGKKEKKKKKKQDLNQEPCHFSFGCPTKRWRREYKKCANFGQSFQGCKQNVCFNWEVLDQDIPSDQERLQLLQRQVDRRTLRLHAIGRFCILLLYFVYVILFLENFDYLDHLLLVAIDHFC